MVVLSSNCCCAALKNEEVSRDSVKRRFPIDSTDHNKYSQAVKKMTCGREQSKINPIVNALLGS
jgi:hypothetical protein